jgi:hypothetical protein
VEIGGIYEKNGQIRVALFFKGHNSFKIFIESLKTWAKPEVLNVNTFFTNGSRKYGTSGAPRPKPPFFFYSLLNFKFFEFLRS